LLPYMEQNNVYTSLVPSPQAIYTNGALMSNGWWNNATYFGQAQTRIKPFVCPSDSTIYNQSTGVFVIFYCDAYSLTFTGGYYPNPTGNLFGRTDYQPSGGSIGAPGVNYYGQFYGPFTDMSNNKVGAIPDGTAYTIFFLEALGGGSSGGPGTRDFAASWMGAGSFATAWGTQGATAKPASQWYQSSSFHTAVNNFAFGDGSVRPIKQGIGTSFFSNDWYQYMYASGMQDGQVLQMSALGQ